MKITEIAELCNMTVAEIQSILTSIGIQVDPNSVLSDEMCNFIEAVYTEMKVAKVKDPMKVIEKVKEEFTKNAQANELANVDQTTADHLYQFAVDMSQADWVKFQSIRTQALGHFLQYGVNPEMLTQDQKQTLLNSRKGLSEVFNRCIATDTQLSMQIIEGKLPLKNIQHRLPVKPVPLVLTEGK